jgi:hypothetical protein
MSFLESIQHGLEKASQEAAHITKIQHLHNVATDLTFRVSQEGQTLITKAMELYYGGALSQGELVAICQQIATYQQQMNEVHTELQQLQSSQEESNQPEAAVPPPPAPAGYPAYPPAAPPQAYAPGTVPYAYPPYPAQAAGYPAYPAPAGYPPTYPQPAYAPYPAVPSSETPTKPGAPAPDATIYAPSPTPSSETPTRPGAPAPEAPTPSSETPTRPGTPAPEAPPAPVSETHHKHRAPAEHAAEMTPEVEPNTPAGANASVAAGSYAQGVLPPIFSPFINKPAAASETPTEAEPEKPAKAHHKKAAEAEVGTGDSTEAPDPVKEKKARKAAEPQA